MARGKARVVRLRLPVHVWDALEAAAREARVGLGGLVSGLVLHALGEGQEDTEDEEEGPASRSPGRGGGPTGPPVDPRAGGYGAGPPSGGGLLVPGGPGAPTWGEAGPGPPGPPPPGPGGAQAGVNPRKIVVRFVVRWPPEGHPRGMGCG
jgi:hypothetical protein